MSTRLKEKGRKAATLLLSMLVMLNVSSQGLTAFAADKDKGIEVTVDRTALDKSVKEAQDAGVKVNKEQDVDKGVATSKAELDKKVAEIQDDYNQQIQKLKQAKQNLDEYNAKKAEYDKKKQKYDEDLAKYNKAKQDYEKALEEYKKAMAELEKRKNEDGYLTKPHSQTLIFKSEPNANMNVSTTTYTKEEFPGVVRNIVGTQVNQLGWAFFEQLNNGLGSGEKWINSKDRRVVLTKNQPVTVTYTNLQHSMYNGKKIC
ncbi:GbpC/Spa domain-containing protein [Gemella cuniculi]|uniref:GbpC/Spa domain-containing protein n=1 Tax=Gemella cuniculi TaxID=150240 RepID=UPI000415E7A6|nr:GbpC/Spa domain-containing protein [Gemella cuniculi]